MRIDIVKNMKAIIQQEKRRTTRRWVIFFGGVFGVCYLFILLSVFVLKKGGADASDPQAVNKFESSVVHVDAFVAPGPTKHATGSTMVTYHSNYRPAGLIRHEGTAVNPVSHSVETKQPAASQTFKVHTTSSAQVHNVGSGVSAGSAATGTTHVSSSVPFSTSTSNMVMSTALWTSSRALTAQNTIAAEQQLLAANSADAVDRPGEIRRVGGKPLDPFMDPIGDALPALLLAALAYAAVIVVKRKRI